MKEEALWGGLLERVSGGEAEDTTSKQFAVIHMPLTRKPRRARLFQFLNSDTA